MASKNFEERSFIVIDLKSFYASVECVDRGLDPMTTNLVVADPERGRGTICLAITPAMKAKGIKNRCRLCEIPDKVKYIVASPRMKRYIQVSAEIYGIYLDYISKDDIHVYSIDEAFIDVTPYLKFYKLSAVQLGKQMIEEVFKRTGIRATCGVGTNLYLAKIALDITAKKSSDFIGFLNEDIYTRTLWEHQPLTDFWRIGRGTAKTLAKYGIYTMGGIAKADQELLYRNFGIDAELLIDHAWGRESATMADIKAYRPVTSSISSGQVLMRDYNWEEGKVIVSEMTENLCLELLDKGLVTNSVSVSVGYSRKVNEEWSRGSVSLPFATNLEEIIVHQVIDLYDRIVKKEFPIRRFSIFCNNVVKEDAVQCSMFDNDFAVEEARSVQKTVSMIKHKFGKNSILKCQDYQEWATARQRNLQIGGHKSGE